MKSYRVLLATAISGALAAGAMPISTADDIFQIEKCYGVAKAGKNDCGTSTTSCAHTSTEDNQPDAWIMLPAGVCEKLVGGSLTDVTKKDEHEHEHENH